ncbi:MAG: TIGR03768 family metallophosphoesterase, partial [Methanospirillum sp.]|nr:TIGR03768 family metallophosphoesterase [Methanospirillum sp.]
MGIAGAYPIDSTVVTTVNRTVLPVEAPSASNTIFPYEVSKYAANGYGVWKFGEGLGYEKRTDLISSNYSNASETDSVKLLRFFDMT